MPDLASDRGRIELLKKLKADGAVLVPVQDDKKPVHRGWNRRRTRVRRCLKHLRAGGRLAVIPNSAGFTVIDVDNGDWTELVELYPPVAVTRTLSGGAHLWYRDSARRRPRTWDAHGCSGDIVGTDAYAVLWEGMEALQSMLESDVAAPYPAEMISRAPRAEPGTTTPRTPLDHSSAAQAYRGRRSGISRGRVPRVMARVAKAMYRDGLTQQKIALELERSTRTVRTYLDWDVEPAVDWKRGLEELKKLQRVARTDRKRLAKATERAEANLRGGTGGSGTTAGVAVVPDPETSQPEGCLDGCGGDSGGSPECGVHGSDYRHWAPPSVRAVQLTFYRLRALAYVGAQSKSYPMVTRVLQRYLRAISRRSCPVRSAAVEAQAECYAQVAYEAENAGVSMAAIMSLIRERRYAELYQVYDRDTALQTHGAI